MTKPLPPLNEADNNETERSYQQQTRPYVPPKATPAGEIPHVSPPNATPSGTMTRVTPPTQSPPRGGHVQPPTGQMRPAYRPPTPRKQNQNALYLPWWSVVVMLIVVLLLAFGIVGIVITLGANQPALATTPIIRIITAVPTLSNQAPVIATEPPIIQVGSSNPPAQMALEGPTLEVVVLSPTPVPITMGSTVVVSGVDQEQLNIRDSAGVQGTTILYRAVEGATFTIIDGPSQADGFTWWKIQNVTDPTQGGWAVANYLQVVIGGQ